MVDLKIVLIYFSATNITHTDERMKDAYDGFFTNWYLTEEMMNAKKSRIITAAWQAAF